MPTTCQTPDAVFHVKVGDREICAAVDLPFPLGLDEEEAAVVEANVHNALELVLAPYFRWR
jgi:hypothetical protein